MNILAFGAHPDDIEIGMGGTLAKLAQNNNKVIGIVATLPSDKSRREKESINAGKILGIDIMLLDIDFNNLFFSREIVKIIDNLLRVHNPDIVFTHWNHDSHQDHNALTDGVIASTRKNNCSVYMYEQTLPGGIVPQSFHAQMFVDISSTINEKIKSVNAHQSQIERNNNWWLEGIRGRAMYRGNQINVAHAEAFEIIKQINYI